jgi:putative transposase
VEEVQAMSGARSPSTGRRYPRTLLCAALWAPRSSVYAAPAPARPPGPHGKCGPKTVHADAALVIAIREILASSPFHGEGLRKVRARLAHRGLPVSGKRVLRLMRQHGLLAPRRLGAPTGIPSTPARSSPTGPT